MKSAPISKEVSAAGLRIDVRKYADGRYGFDWTDEFHERKKVRLKTEAEAVMRAKSYLGTGAAGHLDISKVSRRDLEEFFQWRAKQRPKAAIPDLVASFIASKEKKGRSEWHLRGLKNDLDLFSAAFPGSIDELSRERVEQWLSGPKRGARRWNNLLASVISLHKFARRERLLGADLTPVELIEKKFHRPTVGTYSPDEFRRLLLSAEIDWLPALIFGGLCGLRPEEYCPDPRGMKPGLRWEHVLWAKGKLDVPAEVSKVRRRRFVPLSEAAEALLAPWRWQKGPVVPRQRLTHVSRWWAKRSGVTWKPDGLRHSYASYRLALVQNIHELALEMGNSPSIIHAHYLDLKHEEEAVEWFSLTPGAEWHSMELSLKETEVLQGKKNAGEGT